MDKRYYIIRGDRSGVFFGQIKSREGREVTLTNVRRLWHWSGATECCQLAADGVSHPEACKFTMVVPEVVVLDAVELHPCSDKATKILSGVPEWRM